MEETNTGVSLSPSERNVEVNAVTQASLDRSVDRLEKTLERLAKPIWAIIGGIIVVLFLGFVSVLIAMQALVNESNNFKTSTYGDLRDQVVSQNAKIEALTEHVQYLGSKSDNSTANILDRLPVK